MALFQSSRRWMETIQGQSYLIHKERSRKKYPRLRYPQQTQKLPLYFSHQLLECRLLPVILHIIVPPCRKNREHTEEIFNGTCPTFWSDLTTATAKGSRGLVGSLRTKVLHRLMHPRSPRKRGSHGPLLQPRR